MMTIHEQVLANTESQTTEVPSSFEQTQYPPVTLYSPVIHQGNLHIFLGAIQSLQTVFTLQEHNFL